MFSIIHLWCHISYLTFLTILFLSSNFIIFITKQYSIRLMKHFSFRIIKINNVKSMWNFKRFFLYWAHSFVSSICSNRYLSFKLFTFFHLVVIVVLLSSIIFCIIKFFRTINIVQSVNWDESIVIFYNLIRHHFRLWWNVFLFTIHHSNEFTFLIFYLFKLRWLLLRSRISSSRLMISKLRLNNSTLNT